MPSTTDIEHQQALLRTHRRNLNHLLTQAAKQGGESFAPLATFNGIADVRHEIAKCKANLRDWGVSVEDLPGDMEDEATIVGGALPTIYLPDQPLTANELERRAEFAFVQQQWPDAICFYERLLQLRPTNRQAQERLSAAQQQQGFAEQYAVIRRLRERGQYDEVLRELQSLRRKNYYADPDEHQIWAEQHRLFYQQYRAASAAYSHQRFADALALLRSPPLDKANAPFVKELLRLAEGELARITRREITSVIRDGHVAAALAAAAARLQQNREDYEALFEAAELIEQPNIPFAERQYAAELVQHNDLRSGVVTLPPTWTATIPTGSYILTEGMEVHIEAFKLARYPVTVAQFAEFVEADAYRSSTNTDAWWTPEGLRWRNAAGIVGPERGAFSRTAHLPISGLSWYEATAFCNWLTERGHIDGWLDPNITLRLPSEAEWYIAASWTGEGNTLAAWVPESQEWLNADDHDPPFDQPTPVGLFPCGASKCGALDMAGNVWEWCASPSSTYPVGAAVCVVDFMARQQDAPVRGGSFKEPTRRCGWPARRTLFPTTRADDIGLRVCWPMNRSSL